MFTLTNYEIVEVSNNREMHYMELLREAKACKTDDDLCSWVERKVKSLNSFSLDKFVENLIKMNDKEMKILYDKFKEDEVALILIPDGCRDSLVSIDYLGDGDSLSNSVSMLLTGDLQLKYELQIKVVPELILSRTHYDSKCVQNYSASDSFQQQVLETTKPGTYSAILHMMALCNILNYRVVPIYPHIINPRLNHSFFHKTLMAVKNCYPNLILNIMWSSCKNTDIKGWAPNHIVPCIAKNILKRRKMIPEENYPIMISFQMSMKRTNHQKQNNHSFQRKT